MNKLFLEILPFGVALQIICYLMWAFDVFGGRLQYPLGDVTAVQNVFSIDVYSVLLGIGGAAVIGIASLLLKTGTYAIYAMLLWGIGVAFKVVQTFFLAIPNTIGALIPEAVNPLPGQVNPIAVAVAVIVGYAAFWWLFSLVVQRDV
jgi:hypothetical protein